MKVSEAFPRRYVTGEELGGKSFLVTIEAVRPEQMQMQGGRPETKQVMYLAGTRKGVILSRTLAEQIKEILALDEMDEWAGHKVVLYPEPMTVAGKPRVAIRARAPKAAAEAAGELKHEDEEEGE